MLASAALVSLLWVSPSAAQEPVLRFLNHTPALPDLLYTEYTLHQKKAKHALVDAIALYASGKLPPNWDRNPFDDVLVALPLHSSVVHSTDGKGGSDKFYVGPNAIRHLGREFIVYGAGIANDPFFEVEMARLGAAVYGFDCTVF